MAARTADRALPDAYFELVREFPLIHIKGKGHFAQAQKRLDTLLRQHLDAGAEAYLEALTDLIAVYEDENEPIPDAPAKDVLRELVASSGLSQQKLAEVVGITQSTISAVMSGARDLTKEQVVKLAKHFNVSPTVFLAG